VVRAIEGAKGRAIAIVVDASQPGSVGNALTEAASALGPCLGLVNAATPPLRAESADDLPLESLEEYWRVYVLGGMGLVQGLLPAMKQATWGRVVFLGTSALFGSAPAKSLAYLTAKSALLGLMRGLSVELGPAGITSNMVSPGLTITDLTRDTSPRAQMAEAQRNPLRRLARPEDAAQVVAFLLGDEAAFINGAHLPVTGGASP
jgi:3-oxoacyl-[acyl-carrier protein] reductase